MSARNYSILRYAKFYFSTNDNFTIQGLYDARKNELGTEEHMKQIGTYKLL